MTTEASSSASYEVGYKKPPRHTQFKPGQSGYPSGKRKKAPSTSLIEAITESLNEPLRTKTGRRASITRRDLMVRRLVDRAANGDNAALLDLIKIRETAGPRRAPALQRISFAEGLKRVSWDKLTDEFFQDQDRKKREFRKNQRRNDLPLADLLDRALARRVRVTRGGKPVRVSILNVIATLYANQVADADAATIRLLQKLNPEKPNRRTTFTEIERPNADESADLAERHAKEDRLQREFLEEMNQASQRRALALSKSTGSGQSSVK